jgi:hypothetical protein
MRKIYFLFIICGNQNVDSLTNNSLGNVYSRQIDEEEQGDLHTGVKTFKFLTCISSIGLIIAGFINYFTNNSITGFFPDAQVKCAGTTLTTCLDCVPMNSTLYPECYLTQNSQSVLGFVLVLCAAVLNFFGSSIRKGFECHFLSVSKIIISVLSIILALLIFLGLQLNVSDLIGLSGNSSSVNNVLEFFITGFLLLSGLFSLAEMSFYHWFTISIKK